MCLLSSGARINEFQVAALLDSTPIQALFAIWRAENGGVEIGYTISAIRRILADEIYPALVQCAGYHTNHIHLSEPYRAAAKMTF